MNRRKINQFSDQYTPMILQWNAQGIANKKDELLDFIDKNKPQVIAIQETKQRVNDKTD